MEKSNGFIATHGDIEVKEVGLRSKFEPYAKARASAERDVKVARIENVRAKTRSEPSKKY